MMRGNGLSLAAASLPDWGALLSPNVGLGVMVVVAVMSGLFVSRREVKTLIEQFTARLAEKDAEMARLREDRDEWKQAALTAVRGQEVSAEQMVSMVESMATVEQVVRAIRRNGGAPSDEVVDAEVVTGGDPSG